MFAFPWCFHCISAVLCPQMPKLCSEHRTDVVEGLLALKGIGVLLL